MLKSNHFSQKITVFHGRSAPEEGTIAGYAAVINAMQLNVPMPYRLMLISQKNKQYEQDSWAVLPIKYQPQDSLYKQLVFALKYEGVNLLVFKKLYEKLSEKEVIDLLQIEPTGQYSRKMWFLYEWLLQKQLPIDDIQVKTYVPLLDTKLQYALAAGKKSSRHRIINNMSGSQNFCPLVSRTQKLDDYIAADFSGQKSAYLAGVHKDIVQRASAFLLLKDSKASFTIEGESPKSKRAARWGQAIGQAGKNPLTKEELLRLQQLVIENSRFVNMGFRKQGGFVGEHDRTTGEPIPAHISARWQDAEQLTNGLIEGSELLLGADIDPVIAAAKVAFGFVFIHPFADGNGRIHRYLIHHILARKGFSQQGIIFPVSAAILDHIDDYRKVLESYSLPLLDFIEWQTTKDNNIEVLNETIDYYRYFDATRQAEFLYDCVRDTINNIIPTEVKYLERYDEFKRFLDDEYEMPDNMIALLVRFLEQNSGKLSLRAKRKVFEALTEAEVEQIEGCFKEIFSNE